MAAVFEYGGQFENLLWKTNFFMIISNITDTFKAFVLGFVCLINLLVSPQGALKTIDIIFNTVREGFLLIFGNQKPNVNKLN